MEFHVQEGDEGIKLKQHNIEKLKEKILQVDNDLKKFGFSRELVCRVLRSQPMKDKYGQLKEVERKLSIVEKTSRRVKRALNQEIEMEMEIAALMSTQDRNIFLSKSGYQNS